MYRERNYFGLLLSAADPRLRKSAPKSSPDLIATAR